MISVDQAVATVVAAFQPLPPEVVFGRRLAGSSPRI